MASLIAISSQVARGHVGNSASVFVLQRIGHAVWSVPTVVLPYHPGHGRAHGVPTSPADLAGLLDALAQSPWAGEVGGILTGYLAEADQAGVIADTVTALKRRNPALLYCCDPILGDGGRLYVSEQVAEAVRDQLIPLADLATPNLFELGWLTGTAPRDAAACAEAAAALGPDQVLVTSAPAMGEAGIANLLAAPGEVWHAQTARLSSAPNGTGDLMASLFLGHVLNGTKGGDALRQATSSLFGVLTLTAKAGADELALVAAQELLVEGSAPVALQSLAPR